jgi:predicted DNA-binding transcriptional regulator AlpA
MKNKTTGADEIFPGTGSRQSTLADSNHQVGQSATPLKGAALEKRRSRAALSQIRPIPRRGLSRDEAAIYVGIGTTKFDEMIGDGRMPSPIRIDGRKLWDVRKLDLAFDALSGQDECASGTSWDDA